jgi:hypothetical protein
MSNEYGYAGVADTCLWCGSHLSLHMQWDGFRLDRNQPPAKCGAWVWLGLGTCWATCAGTSFIRDALPNDKPWKCRACGEDHEGLAVRNVIGPPQGPRGLDGYFCMQKCGYLFGLALAGGGQRLAPKDS